jgi:glucose-1-phosphate adenylyltransferase
MNEKLRTDNVLTFMLAGGYGSRLFPLTQIRSKPSVPFGADYRIVDFSLSNCVNSYFRKIYVLTQYKSQSLTEHIMDGWNFLSSTLGEFISIVPPQLRTGEKWYQGTADAIFQNINLLDVRRPDYVLIVSADHLYRMDYRDMLKFHIENKADITISALEVSKEEAKGFGVMATDENNRIIEFQEKPQNPKTIPGKPNTAYASMGIYIFSTRSLVKYLSKDAKTDSAHDFGKNIIPNMLKNNERLFAYSFSNDSVGDGYWKDVGTLESYFKASMDIIEGKFNLDKKEWPIYTYNKRAMPSIIDTAELKGALISKGCRIKAQSLSKVLISGGVEISQGVEIENSIIFDDVKIGKNVKIKNAIIDKNVVIKDNIRIGYDIHEDKKRFVVTQNGLVVIPKNMEVIE